MAAKEGSSCLDVSALARLGAFPAVAAGKIRAPLLPSAILMNCLPPGKNRKVSHFSYSMGHSGRVKSLVWYKKLLARLSDTASGAAAKA